MLKDLLTQISVSRRSVAWVILGLLVLVGAIFFATTDIDGLSGWGNKTAWLLGSFLCVWLLTYLLIDPLLRQRQTDTPGFARDIIVFTLYAIAVGIVLRNVVNVSFSTIWGTGAIAAAILGLSLQQTLGNLFAGLSLHLSPAFQVGDWIELSGNIRISNLKETYIGQVEAVTWRCVHLRNENGDTEVFPNLVITQAIVTNLFAPSEVYAPSGLHRRTGRIVIEPGQNVHVALSKLAIALAGIPHLPSHPPEVVVATSDLGGATLDMHWWIIGFRNARIAQWQAFRLATTCLPRDGFPIMGPHGQTTVHPHSKPLDVHKIHKMLEKMELPTKFASSLQGQIIIRNVAPGEGVIRAGDPGESLFWVLKGSLSVVQPEIRSEPYYGLFWRTTSELKAGDWFGEASLLTGALRKETIVADTPCELAEIPKEAFETVLRDEPHFIEHLVNIMERREHELQAEDPHPVEHRDHWRNMIRTWFRSDN